MGAKLNKETSYVNSVYVVECRFCSWMGYNTSLLKNGHCPSCQSPSTKNGETLTITDNE